MQQPWHNHPKLKGNYHPDFPDDIKVILHQGGPRLSTLQPEIVWVTITEAVSEEVFKGTLLNQPQQLPSFSQGDTITFMLTTADHNPLAVSEKYLQERADWMIQPCDRCGLPELFDAPSDLIAVIFPDVPSDATFASFSSFCGLCGGTQLVVNTAIPQEEPPTTVSDTPPTPTKATPRKKPWWKFW